MKYKVEIWCSYNYGGWQTISYSKVFEFPFVPFVGLILSFHDGDYELRLEEGHLQHVFISWNVDKEMFEVDLRKGHGKEIDKETIDWYEELHVGWHKHV